MGHPAGINTVTAVVRWRDNFAEKESRNPKDDIAKVVFTPAQFAKWEQGRKVTAEPLLDIQARALAAGWRVLNSAQRYADMCTNLQNQQPDEK